MTRHTSTVLTILASVVLSVLVMSMMAPMGEGSVDSRATKTPDESTFQRVVRTGTLRCGYASWDGMAIKDPNTGQMRGMMVDMLAAAGKMANLKIEWGDEVDWGQIGVALKSNKIDAFCTGMLGDGFRGRYLAYTRPLAYTELFFLVRADDDRFPRDRDLTIDDFNKPEFGMAYTEGDVLEAIVRSELPNVKRVPLPPMGSPADNVMHLMAKKTDIITFPLQMVQSYEKAHPEGGIRLVKMKDPLRVYGNVVGISIDEPQLLQFLDSILNEFVNSSSYVKIKTKYDAMYPGAFLRPARPYRADYN